MIPCTMRQLWQTVYNNLVADYSVYCKQLFWLLSILRNPFDRSTFSSFSTDRSYGSSLRSY
ncbi:unnamed protein product [Sphacelaria rigidula]